VAEPRTSAAFRSRGNTGSCATLAQFSFPRFETSDTVWSVDAGIARQRAENT
jgi:hypothetical protein